ncbi:hypothetical protein [Kitasatospora sp. NPDC001683]
MSRAERPEGAGGAEEEELRVLLRRAVPALAAPQDRLERVLARADRNRRRRRAAGLGLGLAGGLVAAALAAAPATAPGPERGPAGQPTASAPTTGTPSGTPAEPVELVHFPGADGLTATRPPGWYFQPVSSDPRRTIGYLANRQFNAKAPCPASVGPCVPIAPLTTDRVLLTLRLIDLPDAAGQTDGETTSMTDIVVDKDCSGYGGNRELVGHRSIVLEKTMTVELTACAREPSDQTLRQVQQVLDSLRMAGR